MTSEMVMDANVLVALIDRRDKWHPQAVALAMLSLNSTCV